VKGLLSRRGWTALLTLGFLASLAPTAALADSSLAAIKQRGTIKAGVKYDVPSWGYLDPKGGSEPTGFEVDIAREIAKRVLGDPKKITFTQVLSSNRIPMVQNGDIDFFLATATITPTRLQQINMSDEYYKAGQSLLVKTNSSVAKYQDLAGKSVCTAKGSTPETTIKKLVPTANVQTFDGYPECFQALEQGRVDAMTTDDSILISYENQAKDLKLVGGNFTFEPYGAGIAKGNDSLTKAINDALKAMGNDGTYAALYQKWIHRAPPADWKSWYGTAADKAGQMWADQAAERK